MSEINKNSLESSLRQLKCHFTWNLIEEENSVDDFEDRVCNQIEFQNNEFKATTYNILAYIKHLRGQNKAALECLQQAEELIQQEHADQWEIRSLVTWGNYAWVHYHMGQLSEAQSYVDRVKGVCKKFSSPYRINNCPETDCEEGWAWLKCGGSRYERAKVCFEKALERKPKNPEFNIGWAIACYRLDVWPPNQNPINPLREAIRLNPSNQYVKILLALKLQKLGEEEEAESIVEEALEKGPHAIDALCSAAKFHRKKGAFDKAIEVLGETLEAVPNNAYLHYYMGCCYRAKALQIQHERYEEKEKLPELIEQAVDHLKKADDLNVNVSNVCSYLAGLYTLTNQYEEADYYFQKELRKDLNPVAKQLLHLRYGNFQLYQMRCEEKAIHYFTEGVKINQPSKEREKMKNKLQRIAKMRLSQNKTDAETLRLLSVLDELNGDMPQAGGDSERFRLSSLLPSAPMVEAGDDSHVPSVA